ncbi:MAG: hypothetical protein R2726_18795 [Acidimicrobiales bacterium]
MRTTYVSEIHMPVDQLAMAKALVRRWAAGWSTTTPLSCGVTTRGQAGDLLEVTARPFDGRDDTIVWHHSAWVFADSHDRVGVQVRSDVRACSIAVAGLRPDAAGDLGIVVDLVEHLDRRDGAVRLSVGNGAARRRRRWRGTCATGATAAGHGGAAGARGTRILSGSPGCWWHRCGGRRRRRHRCGNARSILPGAARLHAGCAMGSTAATPPSTVPRRVQADPDLWVARSAIAAAFRTPIPPIVADLEAEARLRRRAELVAVRERYEAEDVDACSPSSRTSWSSTRAAGRARRGPPREGRSRAPGPRRRPSRADELARRPGGSADAPMGGADGDCGAVGRRGRAEVGSVANLADALSLADALDHVVVADAARRDAARFTFARPEAVARDPPAVLDAICSRWGGGRARRQPPPGGARGRLRGPASRATALGKYGHVYTATVEGTQAELGLRPAYGAAGGSSDAVLRLLRSTAEAPSPRRRPPDAPRPRTAPTTDAGRLAR